MRTELETHKCKNCVYCCEPLSLTEPPVCSFNNCYEPLEYINIENSCCDYAEKVKDCELDRCIDERVNDLTSSPTLYTGIQQNKEILPNILVINGVRYKKEVKK